MYSQTFNEKIMEFNAFLILILNLKKQEEISTVILVGGGTRIPKVQDELMKASKKYLNYKNSNLFSKINLI